MSNLLAIYGQPRTGTHLLRAYLRSRGIVDLWAFLRHNETDTPLYAAEEWKGQISKTACLNFLRRQRAATSQPVAVHFKEGLFPYDETPGLRAAMELGAIVIRTTRRDRMAQVKSLYTARRTHHFEEPLSGERLTPGEATLQALLRRFERADAQAAEVLAGVTYHELVYEDAFVDGQITQAGQVIVDNALSELKV